MFYHISTTPVTPLTIQEVESLCLQGIGTSILCFSSWHLFFCSQVQDRAYNNETLSIILPDKYRACDFEGFGLWCRYDNVLFTSITWMNAEVFVSNGGNSKSIHNFIMLPL